VLYENTARLEPIWLAASPARPVVVTGTGELARCLEHQAGHLRGELYSDGLTGAERRAVMRQLRAVVA
jgi:peptide deformylase